ncbi:MAG: hypothetical protein HOK91_19730 [Gammaproteobacteria bacterium]|nr:hypothetical protein [Gammaproteobacteria bacterium]
MPELMKDEKPPKPTRKKSRYPTTVKVRTWTFGATETFAVLMKRALSSDKEGKTFVYKKGRKTGFHKKNWRYTENRQDTFPKRETHKTRLESQLWQNTVDWKQEGWRPYLEILVVFNSDEDLIDFCRVIKQRLSPDQKSVNFPLQKTRPYKYGWKSKWKDPNPKYPIYVVSKNRGDTRHTSRSLERMNVPYFMVIEPQDYDEYACVIDPKKILVLPFSNHGDGPGRARNWCWDHSMSLGYERHWVMDDNIDNFYRLHGNRRHRVLDGGMFRVCEEFVDRFKNVPVSGLQYRFFCHDKQNYPPFVLNTRIYSVLLIENSCRHRWRGRYNEDTDLSLNVLKDGDCVLQFNALLQGKLGTQVLKGGNTDEFYSVEGTWNKSIMLEKLHPDVVKTVWKFGRYHHHVDYKPFRDNKPEFIDGYDPEDHRSETDLFGFERVKTN